jgi:hypothetical protein
VVILKILIFCTPVTEFVSSQNECKVKVKAFGEKMKQIFKTNLYLNNTYLSMSLKKSVIGVLQWEKSSVDYVQTRTQK